MLTHALAVSLAVSMDAFAVSIVEGLSTHRRQAVRAMVIVAVIFGLTQGSFTLAGFFLGAQLAGQIDRFDHWLAFALLFYVATHMIFEAFFPKDCPAQRAQGITMPQVKVLGRHYIWRIFLLGVATSIDALALGFSLSLLQVDKWLYVLPITLVTAIMSALGMRLGRLVSPRFITLAQILGGLTLLVIALQILLKHNAFQ